MNKCRFKNISYGGYFLRLLRIVELNIIRHIFRALLKFAFAKLNGEIG